jgi:small subunit ribosomal protein S16
MVKIRLARRGRKKLALYDIVVTDTRSPRDGRFIEKIGIYNPATVPASVELNEDKAFDWMMKGAQPSDTVAHMLSTRGVLLRRHLQIGVVKGAIAQETADAKLAEWKKSKEALVASKGDNVAKAKAEAKKKRYENEVKIKEARTEAIKKKAEAAKAVPAPVAEAAAEAPAETPAE